MLANKCFQHYVKNQNMSVAILPGRLTTQVWNVEFHTKSSGLHPVVTDLRDLTFILKFA